MASRRRNIKTHPKLTGDDGQPDNFMPLDRPDRDTGVDSGRVELVDVFGKDEPITVDTETGGDGVDLNSASEGDGRSMSSEESGDASGDSAGDRAVPGARRGADTQRTRGGADNGGDGGAAEEGDGDSYSARVRKRIARERGLVNRERALREQTQRELAEERAARVAQEERIARLERAQTDITGNAGVKELEAKIAALQPQLAAAMEAGETAKVLELQDKISDLKADIRLLKYDLQQKQKAAEAQGNTRQQRAADTSSVVDNPEVANLVMQFQKANRHWWNRTANKDAKQDAITIDKEILGEISAGELGFEPYSDEHFEEVARRLHETHPDLEIQDLDGQPYNFDDEEGMNERDNGRDNRGARGPQAAARGAPVNRMGQNGRRAPNEVDLARQGKVTLDQHDFATMRLFKMDPNNAEHKKYFAKEKMRSIITGDRRAGGNR